MPLLWENAYHKGGGIMMSQLIRDIIHLAKRAMTLEMEYRGKSREVENTDDGKFHFFLMNEIRNAGKIEAYGEILELLGIDVHKYEEIKNKHGYYNEMKEIFKRNAEEFNDLESVKGL